MGAHQRIIDNINAMPQAEPLNFETPQDAELADMLAAIEANGLARDADLLEAQDMEEKQEQAALAADEAGETRLAEELRRTEEQYKQFEAQLAEQARLRREARKQ